MGALHLRRPILQNRTISGVANHTLISEPTTTSATPIQNGMPNVTPNRSVLEAVENSGVAYEPIASVSILPCSMPYPQHA